MALQKEETPVDSWISFVQMATKDFEGKWFFRGVLDSWPLETTIERAAGDWGIELSELPRLERDLIQEFRRSLPTELRANAPQDSDDYLGYLALMQHHGAPTRLLDWSYSPFVAAYFALEALLANRKPKVPRADGAADHRAAVWAVSDRLLTNGSAFFTGELEAPFKRFCETRDGKLFRDLFLREASPVRVAYAVSPFALNQRLSIQQGVFMCPGDISVPFEQNLGTLQETFNVPRSVRKLLLPRGILGEAFDSLFRMNMHRGTLFPGIDGYSSRLRTRLDFLAHGDIYRKMASGTISERKP